MNALNQADPRWGHIRLGACSRNTIATDGCFITSLAMLLYTTPDVINTQLIKHGGYSNGCLINSEKASKILNIPYHGRVAVGSEEDYPMHPCILEVDYSSKPGRQQHFVVWLGFKTDGDWIIKDPLLGKNVGVHSRYQNRLVSFRLFEEVKPVQPDVHEELQAAQDALKVANEHLATIEDIINSK